jgi:hypothetical protein
MLAAAIRLSSICVPHVVAGFSAHSGVLPEPDSTDDIILLVAALAGFVVCGIAAALCVRVRAFEQEFVMAGGMVTLVLFVIYLNFCPSCTPKKAGLSPIESITPQIVFIGAGCMGVMIGGLLGGALKYYV